MGSSLLIRQFSQTFKCGAGKIDKQVLENAREELLLGKIGIIHVGLVLLLHAQEALFRQARHSVHHRRVGNAPALIQDFEHFAYQGALTRRTRPDEFHDLGLQIAEHLADARSIWPEHAAVRFGGHLLTPLLGSRPRHSSLWYATAGSPPA